MNLGERLRSARLKRNWSQQYVAEQIGISNSVLSNYERNYRDPDTETLAKLIKLYDVSADYILSNDEKIHKRIKKIEQFSDEEISVLEQLQKHPQLLADLAENPEEKIEELVQLIKLKQLMINKPDDNR